MGDQALLAAAILLSLIDLVLLGLAYVAWKAARVFEEARRQELRAYVDLEKLVVEAPETDGLVKSNLVFKNTGQTPAFDQRSATEVSVHGEDIPIMPLPERMANSGTLRLGRDATSASIVECQAARNRRPGHQGRGDSSDVGVDGIC
jgi:hypothetical protein